MGIMAPMLEQSQGGSGKLCNSLGLLKLGRKDSDLSCWSPECPRFRGPALTHTAKQLGFDW